MKEKVYALLRDIPAGKVITYGQLAQLLGNRKLARTVGNILHDNPDPAHNPCHRVVNSRGEVAPNYAFGGGSAQRKRLEQEGIRFDANGRVDLGIYGVQMPPLHKVRITAIRQTCYPDLMAKYENPITHACDIREGMFWISEEGKRPEGFCESAWSSMAAFVKALAAGEGDFYDGWMRDPYSAMISCNDGFRPVSFYLERVKENESTP